VQVTPLLRSLMDEGHHTKTRHCFVPPPALACMCCQAGECTHHRDSPLPVAAACVDFSAAAAASTAAASSRSCSSNISSWCCTGCGTLRCYDTPKQQQKQHERSVKHQQCKLSHCQPDQQLSCSRLHLTEAGAAPCTVNSYGESS